MENFSELVKGIDIKSRQLSLKYEKLQKQHVQLEEKLIETESKFQQLKTIIEEQEKQIQILTIAKSIPTGKDANLAKKKINELLRELDNCIDLLNNKTI